MDKTKHATNFKFATSSKDLPPCPFCGETYFRLSFFASHQIICDKCGTSGPVRDEQGVNYSSDDARVAWNQRNYEAVCYKCENDRNLCNTCGVQLIQET
jgi:Lar family restriction alleviation protein